MTLFLVDCSHYQGPVDWWTYAGFSPAAICKATEGAERIDPRFAINRAGMRAHLRARGYYHFYSASVSVEAQADNFAAAVGRLQPGEFAVLDVEQDAEHARHETLAAAIDARVGGQCWLYGGRQVRTARPVWVARYPRGQYPATGARWRPGDAAFDGEPDIGHVLWQFTDYGVNVPGIPGGHVDVNVHRGDLASLARHALPQEDEDVALTNEEIDKIADRVVAKMKPVMNGVVDGQLTQTETIVKDKVDAAVDTIVAAVSDASGVYEGTLSLTRKT